VKNPVIPKPSKNCLLVEFWCYCLIS